MYYYKACICMYSGDNFSGWQRQKNAVGVQNVIEKALSKIYNEEILISGSGRTDTGVHALGQVFHYKAGKYYDNKVVIRGLNSLLDDNITVYDAIDVGSSFHAFRSVVSKTYEYKIYNSPYKNPFMINRALWVRNPIDIEKLRKTLSYFRGTHDFQSFCVKKTMKENTVRTIHHTEVSANDNNISIIINADGFLHNMVRIIVGTSLDIIKDNREPEEIIDILNKKDRVSAGITAHAYGLYQKAVYYNDKGIEGLYGIPENLLKY